MQDDNLIQLAAGVTHETRNALTSIVGFLQLARQKAGDPEATKRHLDLIEREAMRAVEILEQFLRVSREEAETASEEIDIKRVVQELASTIGYQAGTRGIEVVTRAAIPLVTLPMRRSTLLQVGLNLVLNALHAAPAKAGKIEIDAAVRDGWFTLVVADNGVGVPLELREKIFEPFFSTKPHGEGTGLGLAVCRRLLDGAGGTIAYQANGPGAAFVVRLPVGGAS